jgi:hypothetical protein
MAKKAARRRVTATAKLVEEFTARWAREVAQGVPPEFKAHMSASIREGLLALAAVWESALRGAEARARHIVGSLEQVAGREGPADRSRRRTRRRSR